MMNWTRCGNELEHWKSIGPLFQRCVTNQFSCTTSKRGPSITVGRVFAVHRRRCWKEFGRWQLITGGGGNQSIVAAAVALSSTSFENCCQPSKWFARLSIRGSGTTQSHLINDSNLKEHFSADNLHAEDSVGKLTSTPPHDELCEQHNHHKRVDTKIYF